MDSSDSDEKQGSSGSDYRVSDFEKLEEGLSNVSDSTTRRMERLMRKMEDLDSSLQHLISIFERAGKKIEGGETSKMDRIIEQNKQLADGIISLVDMVNSQTDRIDQLEEDLKKKQQKQPKPNPPSTPGGNAQQSQEKGKMPPPPVSSERSKQKSKSEKSSGDIPEPPKKKKGFFSKFKND